MAFSDSLLSIQQEQVLAACPCPRKPWLPNHASLDIVVHKVAYFYMHKVKVKTENLKDYHSIRRMSVYMILLYRLASTCCLVSAWLTLATLLDYHNLLSCSTIISFCLAKLWVGMKWKVDWVRFGPWRIWFSHLCSFQLFASKMHCIPLVPIEHGGDGVLMWVPWIDC